MIGAVGFTGTRHDMSERQRSMVAALIALAGPRLFHHGDCTGADVQAADIANQTGAHTVAHPPSDARYRGNHRSDTVLPPAPYRTRNRAIVESSQLLIAAPLDPDIIRSGTMSTVRMADHRGVPVLVVDADAHVAPFNVAALESLTAVAARRLAPRW